MVWLIDVCVSHSTFTHLDMDGSVLCTIIYIAEQYMSPSATRRIKLPQRLSHVCVLCSVLMYSFRAVSSTKVSCQNGSFVGVIRTNP